MVTKIWKFDLEDGSHTVQFRFYERLDREILLVDSVTLFQGPCATFESRHLFMIGPHKCEVQRLLHFSFALDVAPFRFQMRVDGQPVEMLLSQSLLRPAQAVVRSEELLRAASGNPDTVTPAEELLQPGSE